MRQHAFEALHQEFWQQFEQDLNKLEQKRQLNNQRTAEFGPQYRTLCHHLALANSRNYSAGLCRSLRAQAALPTQKLHPQTIQPIREIHLATNLPPRKSGDCVGPFVVLRTFIHLLVADLASS